MRSASGPNIYRYDTFLNCEGALTLRHGNRCTVQGNFLFGKHKPGTGGVPGIGEDHVVVSNYFTGLAGDGSRSALTVMNGITNVVDRYLAGGGRVYVQTGPRFDYAARLDGYRRGRSYALNGLVVTLAVNGTAPGEEVQLRVASEVAVQASMATQVPLDRVELIVNGRAVHSEPFAGKTTIELRSRTPIGER